MAEVLGSEVFFNYDDLYYGTDIHCPAGLKPMSSALTAMVEGKDVCEAVDEFLAQHPYFQQEDSPVPGHNLFHHYFDQEHFYDTGKEYASQLRLQSGCQPMSVRERLISYVEEITAIRYLYIVCKQVLSERKCSRDILKTCKILHYMYDVIDVINKYELPRVLPYDDKKARQKEAQIERGMSYLFLDGMPLAKYADLFRQEESKMQIIYGYEKSGRTIWYYDTKQSLAEAEGRFLDKPFIGASAPKKDIDWINGHTAIDFANAVLDAVNAHLESYLKESEMSLNIKSRCVSWTTKYLDVLLYQWLAVDIMLHKQLRVCPLCNTIFEASKSNQVYCGVDECGKMTREYLKKQADEHSKTMKRKNIINSDQSEEPVRQLAEDV